MMSQRHLNHRRLRVSYQELIGVCQMNAFVILFLPATTRLFIPTVKEVAETRAVLLAERGR